MGETRFTIAATAALLAAASLTGCSGASAGDGRDCVEVSDALLAQIADGAKSTPIEPVDGAAVLSKTRDGFTLVAMSFQIGAGDEPDIGVWGVTSIEAGAGLTVAVDGFAHQFTDWPDEIDGETLSASEDGVDEAIHCLEQQG